MKSEKLLRAMGDLPEEWIAEANTRRRHPLVRMAAFAACLAVLLVGMYPFLQAMVGHGGADNTDGDIDGVRFGGAFYELVSTDYHKNLEQLDLPETITSDMAGAQVEVLPGYGTVYQYAPLEGKNGSGPAALYLLHGAEGRYEGWWYLVFHEFISIGDSNDYVEAQTMFQVYGVRSAGDIASVTDAENGAELLTPAAFYSALLEAPACGRDTFSELTCGDAAGEEAQLAAGEALHAGAVQIRLETVDGLVDRMTYYPSVGILAWNDSYYQVGQLL